MYAVSDTERIKDSIDHLTIHMIPFKFKIHYKLDRNGKHTHYILYKIIMLSHDI